MGEYLVSETLGLPPLLSEISPKDYRLNLWKRDNLLFSQMLKVAFEASEFEHSKDILLGWHYRSSKCGTFLKFRNSPDGLKLNSANFCTHRLCPLCSRRRSQMWGAKIAEIIPKLELSSDDCLFLTLTVKNFLLDRLSSSLVWLSQSVKRLLNRLRERDLLRGYIRSLEITMPANPDYCHPHYHLVLAVKPHYFTSSAYVEHQTWRVWWQESLRVDYLPLVHIRRVTSAQNALLEAIKYELKPGEYKKDWKWLVNLALNIKGSQRFSTGGIFREQLRFLEYDPDMIHEADRQWFLGQGKKQKNFTFSWDPLYKQFLLQSKEDFVDGR